MLNKDLIDAAEVILTEQDERIRELTCEQHSAMSITAEVLLKSAGVPDFDMEGLVLAWSMTEDRSLFDMLNLAARRCEHGEVRQFCEATH